MTFPLPLITAFIAAVDDTLTWGRGRVGRSSTIVKRDWLNKLTSDYVTGGLPIFSILHNAN